MIKEQFLESLASDINNKINNVLLNDTEVISSFLYKKITNNEFELELRVPDTIKTLYNFKCRLQDGTIISNNDVNIPITKAETTLIYKIQVRGE